VVAFAHGAGGADDGPDGEGAAEGDEGFFADAADEFLGAGFVVEVAVGRGWRLVDWIELKGIEGNGI